MFINSIDTINSILSARSIESEEGDRKGVEREKRGKDKSSHLAGDSWFSGHVYFIAVRVTRSLSTAVARYNVARRWPDIVICKMIN